MHTHYFEIKTLAPLSHGDFNDGLDTGNAMLFRRMPVVSRDEEIVATPVISGNSLRGVMRRYLTREFIERLGFRDDKLYIALANGGALNKSVDAYIRPERVRQIREAIPILSAFGSALYSFMLPGVLNMGFAILKCAELGTGDKPIADLLTDISQTRHIEVTEAVYDGVKPMPYTIEAVIKGAVFACNFSFLDAATDMDKAVVAHGLNGIHTLGGKWASGFGAVELAPDRFDDTLYVDWLGDMTDEKRDAVRAIVKDWK